MPVRDATPDDLATWDVRAVEAPGGHVYQSRAWAAHRAASGWQTRFLIATDGAPVLALQRRWPIVPGGSAYVPRGPAPLGLSGGALANRQIDVARTLIADGIDVVACDPEIPAHDEGFIDGIRTAGFAPIEEIQPSRHRVTLPLDDGVDEMLAFGHIAKSTRQRIRSAEGSALVIVRHDTRLGGDGVGEGFVATTEPAAAALDRFYDLLLATGERRNFSFGPRAGFVAWWRAAHAAGHLIHLEVRDGGTDGPTVAGLMLYRHGGRLSTVHSGDRAETRRAHPGALHLARWRAIQLAIREGCQEMDLGGADVAGARREPREDEPMWGLYQHKRSFGGQWLELVGAHELVARPRRYTAGRLASRVTRVFRR